MRLMRFNESVGKQIWSELKYMFDTAEDEGYAVDKFLGVGKTLMVLVSNSDKTYPLPSETKDDDTFIDFINDICDRIIGAGFSYNMDLYWYGETSNDKSVEFKNKSVPKGRYNNIKGVTFLIDDVGGRDVDALKSKV